VAVSSDGSLAGLNPVIPSRTTRAGGTPRIIVRRQSAELSPRRSGQRRAIDLLVRGILPCRAKAASSSARPPLECIRSLPAFQGANVLTVPCGPMPGFALDEQAVLDHAKRDVKLFPVLSEQSTGNLLERRLRFSG